MNENCDMGKCVYPKGEVRVLPEYGGNNSIVCHYCYEHIMLYRERYHPQQERPEWESLKVYDPGE